MRLQDPGISRQANKTAHQIEKNIFEKNSFTSIAIVETKPKNNHCRVKLIPTIPFSTFEKDDGYSKVDPKNPIVEVLIPKDVKPGKGDIVLVVFTDNDFRKTFEDIKNGKSKSSQFIEKNKTKNDINYGIITNVLL